MGERGPGGLQRPPVGEREPGGLQRPPCGRTGSRGPAEAALWANRKQGACRGRPVGEQEAGGLLHTVFVPASGIELVVQALKWHRLWLGVRNEEDEEEESIDF